MSALVSSEWLAEHMMEVRIIDASWHMPSENRNARAEYEKEHLPGAAFIDIDTLSDQDSPFPHMLPSPQAFSDKMDALGIKNTDHVIVYDSKGIFSAPRLWWMFRVFGHHKVSVLDGGLPKWKAEGRRLSTRLAPFRTSRGYQVEMQTGLLRTFKQMKANSVKPKEEVVDARSAARFKGEAPEPREGLKSGNIPGSKNLPWNELVMPPYQVLRTPQELQALFTQAGVDMKQPLTTTCGSGVSACILALALYEIGKKDAAVYDGSWAEWGAQT